MLNGKNKPQSMSVREWLVRVLSQRDHIPQTVVEAVVKHQYDEASQALKTNNSVEISGFGKFVYNVKKAEKEMANLLRVEGLLIETLEKEELSEKKRQNTEKKLNTVRINIKALKTKNE